MSSVVNLLILLFRLTLELYVLGVGITKLEAPMRSDHWLISKFNPVDIHLKRPSINLLLFNILRAVNTAE